MKANPGGKIDLEEIIGRRRLIQVLCETVEQRSLVIRLAVRLLRTGIDFVKAGGKDRGILLAVTSAERAILAQTFGLAETEQKE